MSDVNAKVSFNQGDFAYTIYENHIASVTKEFESLMQTSKGLPISYELSCDSREAEWTIELFRKEIIPRLNAKNHRHELFVLDDNRVEPDDIKIGVRVKKDAPVGYQ